MKVFIVFLALVMVFSAALIFTSDIAEYVRLQKRLKVLAEDCAEAAALCIDQKASESSGSLVIDLSRGRRAAEELCRKAADSGGFGRNAQISVKISPYGRLGVRADLVFTGRDLFRLAFLRLETFSRSAAYEWKQQQGQ